MPQPDHRRKHAHTLHSSLLEGHGSKRCDQCSGNRTGDNDRTATNDSNPSMFQRGKERANAGVTAIYALRV